MLVWKITAYDGVPIEPEYIALSQPEQATGISHYMCYLYEVTFLGSVPIKTDDPQVLNGLPDAQTAAVVDPVLTLNTVDGGQAKTVKGGSVNYCEVPAADRLPAAESNLVPQFPYTHGVVGAVAAGAPPEAEPASVS